MSCVIYTDLDGTLLDHDTYSWAAAQPMLDQLAERRIPVVPCTSKTRAELLPLRAALGLNTPFIIENGAAVLIPDDAQLVIDEALPERDGFRVKTFVPPRQRWLVLIADAYRAVGKVARGFSEMAIDDIVGLTGLTAEEAARAAAREYGEPLQWLVPPEERQAFVQRVMEGGGVILQGGRFAHVSGASDKGQALRWLHGHYRRQAFLSASDDAEALADGPVSVAAGDSHNDVAMLEAADWALRVRSAAHAPPALDRRERVVTSDACGPAGWAEGLTHILAKIGG